MEDETEKTEKERLEEMLEETRELTRANYKILRSLQRSSRFRRLISLLYIVLLIGSLLFTYYYLQPYIDNLAGIYNISLPGGQASSTRDAIQELIGD